MCHLIVKTSCPNYLLSRFPINTSFEMSCETNNGVCSGVTRTTANNTRTETNNQRSEIADFFDGRSVFITGATGFVGSLLLEQLLRCCPGLEGVYILMRKKKDSSAYERMNELLRKKIFSKLSETNLEIFKKITVVPGDLALENLGISPEIESKIIKNVSVVFHSAADLTFNKSLSHMIKQNCLATETVITLCRRLEQRSVLIYVSSLSSTFWRNKWEETFPTLQVSSRVLMEAARRGDTETLSALAQKCQPPWPNSYTFSKAIAENFLHTEVTDIPFAVIRPTMVVFCSEKASLPGYIPDKYAFTSMFSGITRGFFRVFCGDPNMIADIIPADTVANTILTAAWYLYVKNPREPFVVNNSSATSALSARKSLCLLAELGKNHPPPNLYQEPYLLFENSYWTYLPSALINHYMPALFMDAVRIFKGKKPKFVKMYLKYDIGLYYSYFIFHAHDMVKFPYDNYIMLMDSQNQKDREIFPIDVRKQKNADLIKLSKLGAPYYDRSNDRRTPEERIKIARRTHVITTSIKWISATFFMVLIGIFLSDIFTFIL